MAMKINFSDQILPFNKMLIFETVKHTYTRYISAYLFLILFSSSQKQT